MSDTKPNVVEVTFELNELIQMKDVLQKVFDAKLPIKTAYRLSKVLSKVNAEYESFEKMRFTLFQRYGEEKDNEQMVIKPEYIEEFTAELTELLNQPVKIHLIKTNLEELDGRVELTPIEISRMEKLLEE